MLILECSQGYYGRTDGSVTISLRKFVGEGIKSVVLDTLLTKLLRQLKIGGKDGGVIINHFIQI